MATLTGYGLTAQKVKITALKETVVSGALKYFKNYSGLTGGSLDSGESLNNQTIIVTAAGTDLSVTANYIVGDDLDITQPDPDTEGVITVAEDLPSGATGYRPATVLHLTFTPVAGSGMWVDAWSGATVDSTNPNAATIIVGTTEATVAVSATVSTDQPASRRLVTVTAPASTDVSIDITT